MNTDRISNESTGKGRTMTTLSASERTIERRTAGTLAVWGLCVWLVVAVSARLVGHVLLSPTNPWLVAAVFGSAIPLMAIVTYPVYRWLEIPHALRGSAAALMSIPGMILDALLLVSAESVFPAMGQDAVINFGALLLFGYAIVLLTGFVPGGGVQSEVSTDASPTELT
jgi:hypothetical protein